MKSAEYKDALKHPNWSMGEKITIDSATMMNKLFELLEAKWLFSIDSVDAIIEKKSIIHALVEFVDGSTTAHFATTDMKLPIAYALLSELNESIVSNVNLLEIGNISFKRIETDRYPLWELKDDLLKRPKKGLVLNSANEIAIRRFKSGEYNFGKMCSVILETYNRFDEVVPYSVDDIASIDREVRRFMSCK